VKKKEKIVANKDTTENFRKVDQPKADSIFSYPNTLDDLLQDLTDYENFSHNDSLFQDDNGSLKIEKREPYEDALKAKKVANKVTKKAEQAKMRVKDVKNLDEDNIYDILEDYLDYEKYLGIANNDLPKVKDTIVDTKEFPMDTKPKFSGK
jgi:hypothetical protein